MASLLDALFGAPDEDKKAESYLAGMDPALTYTPEQLQALKLKQYEYQGDYQPGASLDNVQVEGPDAVGVERANAAQVDRSAMEGVNTDPRLKSAQLAALAQLQGLAESGGMTAADRANLARIQSQEAQADRGRRDAITQGMASRGMGGSGMELLAQLQSSQAATDRQAQQDLDVAGMAQDRAMQATQGAGAMGGQLRGQDFSEQSDVARAKDAISQFNAANRQQSGQFNAAQANDMGRYNSSSAQAAKEANAGRTMQSRAFNAGAANDAGMAGWQARQQTSNANTDLGNKQDAYNYGERVTSNNQAAYQGAQGRLGAAAAGTKYWTDRGDATAKAKAGAWEAAGKTVGSIVGGVAKSDEREKKDIEALSDEDIMDFLKSVKPKTYKYKDPNKPGTAPGKRVGFIAQDVKDTKAGKQVVSEGEDGTLEYDPLNLQGVMLAALSAIAKKEDK